MESGIFVSIIDDINSDYTVQFVSTNNILDIQYNYRANDRIACHSEIQETLTLHYIFLAVDD